MGFWDRILNRQNQVAVFSPRVEYIGGNEDLADYYGVGGLDHATPASLWRSQPHLRTVVSFLARNVAQLGLHVYERVGETDRRRDRSSVAAKALAFPDGSLTTFDLVFALVGDACLYDRAFWYVGDSTETPSGKILRRLPPSWVSADESDLFTVKKWRVANGGESITIPASNMLAFTGYSPTDPKKGSPTVESLRATLQEQVEAAKYRGQVWKRGGRVSSVLQRPKDAPQWSDAAREAFREDWYTKFTGSGSKAGGTPILEDGMTLQRIDFNAQEQQFVEAAKLSLTTVAAAFHVNPTMIGQNDGANYSNVREFRKMLYGDTLGPMLAQIEARLNTFLLPMLGVDPERYYVEFNIAEKLQGNFEEQAQALSSAIGGPWMSRAEGRARMNLPAIDGADELIVPLNVLVGGQASPRDSAPKAGRSVQVKAAITDPQRDKVAQVLAAFFERQGKSVLSAIGAGRDWWDAERWDAELADDLHRVALAVSGILGKAEADRLGFPDDFDADLTVDFLKAVAERYAANINATTLARVEETLASDEPDAPAVFEQAKGTRADGIAVGVGTFLAGFATIEAARQIGRSQGLEPTKTWNTGANPRPSHAAVNGETVGIDEKFSNGLNWPGEGMADESAGCNCSVTITIP